MKSVAYPLADTRVLVVEDEYYLADDLSRALADAGAQVVGPVGTLEEAARMVAERKFDCAVVDVNLRGELSFAVAQRLRDEQVPFIIATGYDRASLPDWLRQVPRVEKPFTTGELISTLVKLPVASRREA